MPAVTINGRTYEEVAVTTRTGAPLPVFTGLEIPAHDYISFDPLTAPATGIQNITYKTGGAGGTTVATLTLTFSGGALASVAKS
jgi:hypothetical protein